MDRTRYKPRFYIAENFNPMDEKAREEVYAALKKELAEAKTGADLETWLRHYGELDDAIDEERIVHDIEASLHTDQPEVQKAYADFLDSVNPWFKPKQFGLRKELMNHPAVGELPDYYGPYLRMIGNQVSLFREDNVARENEDEKLRLEAAAIGAMTVDYDGKKNVPLSKVAETLNEPDRARREEAWETIQQRRALERERLDQIYDRQIAVRQAMAKEAGFDNYLEYKFRSLNRFDYTPADAVKLHESIEKNVVPLHRQIQEEKRKKLGLEELRPWDLKADAERKPPLRPFQTVPQLIAGTHAIFQEVDPELAAQFAELRDKGMLDLEGRPGKAARGYNLPLAEARLSFIFMNATGGYHDLTTLLHEGGHAFHNYASREQKLYYYRGENGLPTEFAEVASMSMELLGGAHFDKAYSQEDAHRAHRTQIEGVVSSLPWIAAIDSFQHWVYTHPGHTHEERHAAWGKTMDRFGGIEKWSGHEAERAAGWQQQTHVYNFPLYYIEYAMARDGALQVWENSRKNPEKALKDYRAALALGGSKPLPQLYEAAGIKFDPRGELLPGLMADLRKELHLPQEPVPAAKLLPGLDFKRVADRNPEETAPQLDQGKV